jgi:hypothetical protein
MPRARKAVQAVDERLVRREHGLIQLLDPPFDQSDLDPGFCEYMHRFACDHWAPLNAPRSAGGTKKHPRLCRGSQGVGLCAHRTHFPGAHGFEAAGRARSRPRPPRQVECALRV